MDRGVGRATVHGVTQSLRQLSTHHTLYLISSGFNFFHIFICSLQKFHFTRCVLFVLPVFALAFEGLPTLRCAKHGSFWENTV